MNHASTGRKTSLYMTVTTRVPCGGLNVLNPFAKIKRVLVSSGEYLPR